MTDEIEKNSKLKDVTDIFGNVHKRATVIDVLERTVVITDDETLQSRVVHKSRLDMVTKNGKIYGHEFSNNRFNVKACEKLHYSEEDIRKHGLENLWKK